MTTVASSLAERSPRINVRRLAILAGLAAVTVPLVGNDYWLNSIIIPTIVMGLAGLGLNLLTAYAGLVSLGSAAFMSIGAFSAYNLLLRVPLRGRRSWSNPSRTLAGRWISSMTSLPAAGGSAS
jgi:branched-chain amino acid transport system permease protein